MTSEGVQISLTVDGAPYEVEVEPRWLLSDVLRRQLGKTCVHVGCEQGVCGACTVLLDGVPMRSCLMLAVQAAKREVTTLEGLSGDPSLPRLQQLVADHGGVQCGFCTPGFLVTILSAHRRRRLPGTRPAMKEFLSSHLCRCTGYEGLIRAAEALRDG